MCSSKTGSKWEAHQRRRLRESPLDRSLVHNFCKKLANAGAIAIIHELLHVAGKIPSDRSSGAQSVANTILARMFCEMKPLTTDTTLPNTQPLMLRPIGAGLPHRGGILGGGGSPDWSSLQEFLDWVNSITPDSVRWRHLKF